MFPGSSLLISRGIRRAVYALIILHVVKTRSGILRYCSYFWQIKLSVRLGASVYHPPGGIGVILRTGVELDVMDKHKTV